MKTLIENLTVNTGQKEGLEYAQQLHSMKTNIMNQWNGLNESLSVVDRAISDIQHFIEITPNLNASEGYKLYRDLKELLETRRQIKDSKEELVPLYTTLKDVYPYTIKQEIHNIHSKQKNCHYNTRVLNDIFGDKIK